MTDENSIRKDEDGIIALNVNGLDDSAIKSIIAYTQSLKQPERKANDFAVAKALNERAIEIFTLYADNSNTPDITDINHSYVLLVDELKKIYERTPELKAVELSICWCSFDRIEHIHDDLWEYQRFTNDDYGQSHNAVINTLCIKCGVSKLTFTDSQEKLVAEADKSIANFKKELSAIERNKDRDWFIPEYHLTRKNDGTILVNKVLVLSKTHFGQVPDKMMDFAFKHDGLEEPTKPSSNEIATSRPYTTILGDMGFDATLRALFFPVVSKPKGITFRSYITRAKADAENIDTNELDHNLKDLNAKTERYHTSNEPINLDDIPF